MSTRVTRLPFVARCPGRRCRRPALLFFGGRLMSPLSRRNRFVTIWPGCAERFQCPVGRFAVAEGPGLLRK